MWTILKWQEASQWLPGEGGGRERQEEGVTTKGHKETFGVTDMFSILSMVMVSCACTYVKNFQVVHFKYVQFLYVNYTSKYTHFLVLIIPEKKKQTLN